MATKIKLNEIRTCFVSPHNNTYPDDAQVPPTLSAQNASGCFLSDSCTFGPDLTMRLHSTSTSRSEFNLNLVN